MAKNKQSTLTRELSRNIDAAYEAYKAKELGSADEGDSVAH
jgi:hypothetical protein